MILTVILIIAVIGCVIGLYFHKKNNKPHVDPTPEPKPEPTPDPVVDTVKWKNTKTVYIPKESKILNDVELDVTGDPFIKFEARVNGVIDNNIKFTPSEGNGFTKTTISVDENTSDETRIIEITVKKDGE